MTEVNAVTKMEEGPPQVSYRRDLQTTLRCFPEKCWEVLNGIGKKSGGRDYVRLEKMNESESPMRCRENELPVKTTVHLLRRMNVADILFTGYVAGVIEGA